MNIQDKILSLEKEALDQWSGGNPVGYGMHQANNATYIDDMGAQDRLTSSEWPAYGESLKEMIPPHKYEMQNSHVQVYNDDTAILSYFYQPYDDDGNETTRWRASVVFALIDGQWKNVHSQWTMLKEGNKK